MSDVAGLMRETAALIQQRDAAYAGIEQRNEELERLEKALGNIAQATIMDKEGYFEFAARLKGMALTALNHESERLGTDITNPVK